jgi:hypothetical protein
LQKELSAQCLWNRDINLIVGFKDDMSAIVSLEHWCTVDELDQLRRAEYQLVDEGYS